MKVKVTTPDGQSFIVNAPDDATHDQIYEFVASQHPAQQAKPELDEPGFLVGVGKGANAAVRGVTGLFGKPIGFVESDPQIDAVIDQQAPIGTIVGNMLATAPAMLIPGVNTLKGASLMGAGLGYATNEKDRSQHMVEGALGGAVGNMLPHVFNVASKALAPLGSVDTKERVIGRALNRVTDPNSDDVIARLESAQGLIPGSFPTAAEVAKSGGMAAMQRAVASAYPEQFAQRISDNAAARRAALQEIAGDEAKMQAAISDRDSAVSPLYDIASKKVVQSDAVLKDILDRLPTGTMQTAKDIARMNNEPFQFGKDIPAHTIKTGLLDRLGNPITIDVPAQYSSISGQGIDLLKKAIDDTVNTNPTAAIGKHSKNAGLGVKQELLNWADQKIPEYAQARETYQQLSQPINQMQVGQELLNKLGDSLSNYTMNSTEMKNRYATALNDVRGNLVKQATGGIKRDLEDVMTPDQMDTFKNIAVELGRKQNAENEGRGVGSNTYQNLSIDGLLQAAGVPTWASGLLNFAPFTPVKTGLKMVGNAAYGDAEKTMKGLLADALLDPKETARIMRKGQEKTLADKLGQDKYRALGGLLGTSMTSY